MTIEYDVPFFENTPDDTHCFQAALRMVLKYFRPEQDFSWEDLEGITAKKGDLWTWPTAGLMWLQDEGFKVRVVESFDYEDFIERGGSYLVETFGKDVGGAQVAHSDIEQERRLAKGLLEKVNVEKRIPELVEIESSLRDGWLVICNVNSMLLNHKSGYVGHFVVVIGYDNDSLKIHDPGLPGLEGRVVAKKLFTKAWAEPSDTAKNFVAIKFR